MTSLTAASSFTSVVSAATTRTGMSRRITVAAGGADRRQAAITALQAQLQRREEDLKKREETCAAIEERGRGLLAQQASIDASKADLDTRWGQYEKRHTALCMRREELDEYSVKTSESLRAREVAVAEREKAFLVERSIFDNDVIRREQVLKMRAEFVQQQEQEMVEKKSRLVDQAKDVKRWNEELRTKEEDLELAEKALRDATIAEEKQRRRVKQQEDDIVRRTVELRVEKEEIAAKAEIMESRAQVVQDAEARLRVAQEETATLQREIALRERNLLLGEAEVTRRESEVKDSEARIADESARLHDRSCAIAQREKELNEIAGRVEKAEKHAGRREDDVRRREIALKDGEKSVAALRQAMEEWAESLHWRERELRCHKGLPASPIGNRGALDRRPHSVMENRQVFNEAIVDVNLRHAIAQYTAPALIPRRTLTGSEKRAAHQRPRQLPAMRSWSTAVDSQVQAIEMDGDTSQIAADFLREMGHLKLSADPMISPRGGRSQSNAGFSVSSVSNAFSMKELSRLQMCIMRERDHAALAAIADAVLSCPLREPVEPTEKEVRSWWVATERLVTQRMQAVQRDRVVYLTAALKLVESKKQAGLLFSGSVPSSEIQSFEEEVTNTATPEKQRVPAATVIDPEQPSSIHTDKDDDFDDSEDGGVTLSNTTTHQAAARVGLEEVDRPSLDNSSEDDDFAPDPM